MISRGTRYRLVLLLVLTFAAQSASSQPPGRRRSLGDITTILERDSTVTLRRTGVTASLVPFIHNEHRVEALLAQPVDSGQYPGLLLVPGYMRTAKDYLPMALNLAKEGFVCLAVTQIGFGASEGDPDFAGPKTVTMLQTALVRLKQTPMVDSLRLGALGYSRGAMAVGMLCTISSEIKAAVLGGGIYDLERAYNELEFEGIKENIRLETGATPEAFRERSLVHAAASLKCPVLIVHGGKDKNAPVSQAYLLRDKLTELGQPFDIEILTEAEHGIDPRELRALSLEFFQKYLSPTKEK